MKSYPSIGLDVLDFTSPLHKQTFQELKYDAKLRFASNLVFNFYSPRHWIWISFATETRPHFSILGFFATARLGPNFIENNTKSTLLIHLFLRMVIAALYVKNEPL